MPQQELVQFPEGLTDYLTIAHLSRPESLFESRSTFQRCTSYRTRPAATLFVAGPILDDQALDPFKMIPVVRHHDKGIGQCSASDQQIEITCFGRGIM